MENSSFGSTPPITPQPTNIKPSGSLSSTERSLGVKMVSSPGVDPLGRTPSSPPLQVLPGFGKAHSINDALMVKAEKTVTDEIIRTMSTKYSRTISNVDFSGCKKLTDASVDSVTKCEGLESINFSGCRNLTDSGVLAISRLASIKSVSFAGCNKISNAELKSLCTCPDLTSVNFAACTKITNEGLKALSGCNNLREVDFSWCDEISDEGISALARPTLTSVNLSNCSRIGTAAIRNLVKSSQQLVTVTLSGCSRVHDSTLSILSSCSYLTTLDLSECTKITDEGVSNLVAEKVPLKCVKFALVKGVTDASLHSLAVCSGLTQVDFTGCTKITDAGVTALAAACPNMQNISFSLCKNLTNASVVAFSSHKEMCEVDFSACGLLTGDAAIAMVTKCTLITVANFKQCPLVTSVLPSIQEMCAGRKPVVATDAVHRPDLELT